jgi:hypothetical protein
LDGETDWKLRKPIKCVQAEIRNGTPVEEILSKNIFSLDNI